MKINNLLKMINHKQLLILQLINKNKNLYNLQNKMI